MTRPCRRVIFIAAIALVATVATAVAPAQHDTAVLESVAAERVVFRNPDGAAIEMPAGSLVAWGRCPPLPLGPHVVLADGGVIAGTLTGFDGKTATVRSAALGIITLPAADFAGFRATAASRPAETEIEEGRAAGADSQARWFIELRNGDRLSARSLRIHDGLLNIDWQGRLVAVPIDRVQSITTATVNPPQPAATLRVALDDGSRFLLSSVGKAAAVIAADPTLVVALEGQAATSLARAIPSSVVPEASNGVRLFARGRTLAGDWPSARGITGFQGIAIGAFGSPTRIRYDLSRPAQRLESTVAIDDTAGQGGRTIVRVFAISNDGTRQETFASPVLQQGDEPLFIRANLDGARQIELVVEPAEGDEANVATVWIDPRVIPFE